MRAYGTIYGLSCGCADCDENEIRYVGQTINLSHRLNAHKNSPTNRPLGKWIHKHGTKHLRVTELETRVEESELDTQERYWVAEMGTFIGHSSRGLNVTKGGQSKELDPEEVAARKKYQKDNPNRKSLTWEAVKDIRDSYANTAEPVKNIAERYGVVEGTAYSVIMNHNWYDEDYVYVRRSKKGVVGVGEDGPRAKLTWDKVKRIREMYLQGAEQKTISESFGVALGTVNKVVRNRAWIDEDYLPPKPRSVTKVSPRRNCRLTLDEAVRVRERYSEGGITQEELANEYGVSRFVITGVVQGRTYREDIPEPLDMRGMN